MDIYSLTLGAALVTVCLALAVVIAGELLCRKAQQRTQGAKAFGLAYKLLRFSRIQALLTLGLILISAITHYFTGHRSSSPGELGFTGFVAEHPAFLVISTIAIAILIWSRAHNHKAVSDGGYCRER